MGVQGGGTGWGCSVAGDRVAGDGLGVVGRLFLVLHGLEVQRGAFEERRLGSV